MLFKLVDNERSEVWVNPAMVSSIAVIDMESAFISVQGAQDTLRTTPANAFKLIDLINSPAASHPASQPASLPQTTAAEIVAMTRDVTKSGGTMWRCATKRGFMVNVFQHDDPLKDSFTPFVVAGYGAAMTALEPGETLNWTKYPVEVQLQANSSFWNVVSVKDRPLDAQFDRLEEDGSDDDA